MLAKHRDVAEDKLDAWSVNRTMIQSTVTFWGAEKDKDGMPKPYHSYFVFASEPWKDQPDAGVASIIGISGGQQVNRHITVDSGGRRTAHDKAVHTLQCVVNEA
jgi:hypothetical protein